MKKQGHKGKIQDVKKRINSLLNKMTIEEKVRQLGAICPAKWRPDEVFIEDGKFSIEKAKKIVTENGIGGIGFVAVLNNFGPKDTAELVNEIQKFLIEHTRMKIPVIIHGECVHGCWGKGSTMFPVSIALASTFDVELMEKIAIAIGKETRARGVHQALSPVVDIARDPRCGRTNETYGEDPYLVSKMAVAFVKGLQGEKVVCTPKHYVANFVGDGGRDSNAVHFSERLLREVYFPPYRACIMEANALSIMAAYGSSDGIPCSCNKWLLTEILRKEWGFKGFVVSDYGSVDGLQRLHCVAETEMEAAKKAIEAGLDMELPSFKYYRHLTDLIKTKKVSRKVIDESVRRILSVKSWLGLFGNPYLDPEHAARICNCNEHRKLALEAARKSIVLLKNNGILPLRKDIKSIAVIGPNANVARLGGYSRLVEEGDVSVLEGIKRKVGKNTEIYFAEGCEINTDSKKGFEEAIKIAKKSDVVVLCIGNCAAQGAEVGVPNITEGENNDRCNLDLPGVQEDLIKEICNVNKNIIVVLINGSAITMTKWLNDVQSVIEAWYPGEEGGNAIADVLFGDYNPGGKLPITFPKFTGQLPLYYNYKPTGRRYDYVELRGEAEQFLFPFGYGLSYTEFRYSNLKIEQKKRKDEIKVSVDIENIGKYEGDEVALLYLRDVVSSVARPVKELKGFQRITLKPGEKRTVDFILTPEHLSMLDSNLKLVIEPGVFKVMIGNLTGEFKV